MTTELGIDLIGDGAFGDTVHFRGWIDEDYQAESDLEQLKDWQFYCNDGPACRQGFTTILTGPEHPPYGLFCPAPGCQLDFNNLKVTWVTTLVHTIATDTHAYSNFSDALKFEHVIDAITLSAQIQTRATL